MLLTVLREKFKFQSTPSIVEKCLAKFGFTFVTLTRIFHDSGQFDEIPEEKVPVIFELDNWERRGQELCNDKAELIVQIPENYL